MNIKCNFNQITFLKHEPLRGIWVFLLLLLLVMEAQSQTQCNADRLKKLSSEAEFVVIAKVVNVQVPDLITIWSGTNNSLQWVKYKTIEILKGDFQGNTISINHPLVYKSLTSDEKKAQLSPFLFKKGNEVVLFFKLNKDNPSVLPIRKKVYISVDENCGVIQTNQQVLQNVKILFK